MVSSKQILIVDDSPLQAIVLRRFLVQSGFEVTTAKDGTEALEYLKKITFDLIISDINMPNMDGFELCKKVKEDERFCKIPFILCSALTNPEDLIRGIEVGAVNYLTRPYNTENLLKIIPDLLKGSSLPFLKRETEEIRIGNRVYHINASRQDILNFLITTYTNILQQNKDLIDLREQLQRASRQVEAAQKEQEQLLFNIFPEKVAHELMAYGSVTPVRFDDASILFIDFVGFSKSAKNLSPHDLVETLGIYFEKFDEIISHHHLERVKTIGDGYMCVGGVPEPSNTHAIEIIQAALDVQEFISSSSARMKEKYGVEWRVRMGINSGPLVAGVVGKKRFAFDVWGDTVNLASRMESHGIPGEINVSKATYEKAVHYFEFEPRGNVPVRNKEEIERMEEMFLVKRKKGNK